ncbi:barstar family protein [Cupriavidus basilensis]|uniref:barstar family protein n=1 Tax=Cupriavidus basilensis TaxID=68895 RepID=UPI0009E23723|nr:barstar family protein [Cupriavidus basilensis]
MQIKINGVAVKSEMDFHRELASALGVESFYGYNLDALWDLLSSSVERPLCLNWTNASASKISMGKSYCNIVDVLERVKIQDERFGFVDKFTYEIDL